MNRKQFLKELKNELNKRNDIETEQVLFYYDEMIQDAVENGEDEEVFIVNLGPVADIRRRLEDEAEFIVSVRSSNANVVQNVLGTSVKIIGYFIFGVIAFSLTVTTVSVFVSGIAIIFSGLWKVFFDQPTDLYGYLATAGIILVGLSLSLLSIGVFKWFVEQAKPVLLSIFRKLKDLFNRRD